MTRRTALLIALVLAAGAVLFAVGTAVGYYGAKSLHKPPAYTPMETAEFAREWKAAPAAAIQKYGRSGVRLTGTVRKMGENSTRQTYLELEDGGAVVVVFVLSPEVRAELARLRVGGRCVVCGVASDGVQQTPRLIGERLRALD